MRQRTRYSKDQNTSSEDAPTRGCSSHELAGQPDQLEVSAPHSQADWRRSGVKNRRTFHLQRPRYWPTLDRGTGKKSAGCRREPPATGPMCPQIKSPLSYIHLLPDNARLCRFVLDSAHFDVA